jgi:hypothetical protein
LGVKVKVPLLLLVRLPEQLRLKREQFGLKREQFGLKREQFGLKREQFGLKREQLQLRSPRSLWPIGAP